MELALEVMYVVEGARISRSPDFYYKGGEQHERQVAGSHGCRSCVSKTRSGLLAEEAKALNRMLCGLLYSVSKV